jgi:hypothetical protein
LKPLIRPLILGATLLLPASLAVPAYAQTAPSASASASAAASAAATIAGSVKGKGTLTLAGGDGTADFGIAAKSDVGKHGHHGDFRIKEASGSHYNGAIHTYTVNGSSATISGAGGLVDDQGAKHHVTFTATVTAGGPGTGAIDVTFTGKNYSDHYSGTVSSGQISIQS